MKNARRSAGFSLLECIVAFAILMLIFVGALVLSSKAVALGRRIQGDMEVQDNLRQALNHLEKDLRMIGFGVPLGQKIGDTSYWRPSIFHATPTEIAFRADMDGGNTEIICTPKSSSTDCPLDKLLLSSTRYYEALDCDPPDGSSGDLQIVAVVDGGQWEPTVCSSVNVGENSISVAHVTDDTFTAGISRVVTVEQVYYRYVPGVRPRFGRLERSVRYGNEPDDAFPPSSAAWEVVAEHVIDFSIDFENEFGAPLNGNSLSAGQRWSVRKIIISVKGFDEVHAEGKPSCRP